MIKAIICDIEGTTTSLSFVKDTLFPYARWNMAEYIGKYSNDPAIASLLDDVKRVMQRPDATLQDVIAQIELWTDEDKKITPLKAIQCHIWEGGYKNGYYYGHVYADVYEKLKDWHESEIEIYIFSSGSVYAQKLLLKHTEYGYLTPLFSGYFDTDIGAKTDPKSYATIAERIGYRAAEIVFLSDIEPDLGAAESAGLSTVWLVRDGKPARNARHP